MRATIYSGTTSRCPPIATARCTSFAPCVPPARSHPHARHVTATPTWAWALRVCQLHGTHQPNNEASFCGTTPASLLPPRLRHERHPPHRLTRSDPPACGAHRYAQSEADFLLFQDFKSEVTQAPLLSFFSPHTLKRKQQDRGVCPFAHPPRQARQPPPFLTPAIAVARAGARPQERLAAAGQRVREHHRRLGPQRVDQTAASAADLRARVDE